MSRFVIDDQTRLDLSLATKGTENALIFNLYQTVTLGGAEKLANYFNHPLLDVQAIAQRQNAIVCIQQCHSLLQFSKEELSFIEYYLNTITAGEKSSKAGIAGSVYSALFESKNQVYIRARAVGLFISNLSDLHRFLTVNNVDSSAQLQGYKAHLLGLLDNTVLKTFLEAANRPKISNAEVLRFDRMIRSETMDMIKWVLDVIYEIDVLTAVAAISLKLNFTIPQVIDSPVQLLLEDFFHPLISNPVPSSIGFEPQANLCIITGANMAGKSSMLKAMAICVYLAQIGFPVPARKMKCSIFNGLSTTINLADNIIMGHSHFYKEVLRIKKVAMQLADTGRMFIIFDELFRGTNSTDAHEASLVIIKALAKVNTSAFVISTHLAEITSQLTDEENIYFKCLKTKVEMGKIIYTYQLQDGVSHERLGMRIVEDEGLVQHIQQASKIKSADF